MQANRDERAKANEAAMKRMESSQPTPTQEENDLAKLGIHVDEKQDDGRWKPRQREQVTVLEFEGSKVRRIADYWAR